MISLKFVSDGSINNIPALVQIMAWRLPGTKPLFEPMMVRLDYRRIYVSLGLNELKAGNITHIWGRVLFLTQAWVSLKWKSTQLYIFILW